MVYMILADGFEEMEALVPLDILRRGEVNVQTVSIAKKQVTGSHNVTVLADITIDEVEKDKMELLILPGGAGHTLLDNDTSVHQLIDYCTDNQILIGAICASPSILGKKGLLKGKRATCFPSFEKYLDGAIILDEKVVKDGNIITAKGAGASAEFGFLLLELMKDSTTSKTIREIMQF